MPSRGMVLLICGYLFLGVAWMFATPPFQAPDEPAQYLRALTIADGHLLGPRVPIDQLGRQWLRDGGYRALEQRWNDHDRRGVVVPARLSPPGVTCLDDRPDLSGSCTEATYTGDYYPLAYVLPAAAMSTGSRATTALWLARAASLVSSLLLLVIALLLTGPGVSLRTIGMLAAVTPTVLFIGSVLNPSGPELAANLAFIAGLMRLRRDPEGFGTWSWVALIATGVVTILAWQLGPFFALADLAVFAALLGPRRLRDIGRRSPRPVRAAMLSLGVAFALFFVYGFASGALHSQIGVTPFFTSLHGGYDQLWPTLRGAVAIFGSFDVTLPYPMNQIWWLLVLGLLLAALRLAPPRERLVLVLTTGVALAFPVLFYAWSQRNTGFGMQGRYALPILALIPITAGEILDDRASRARRTALTTVMRFTVAVIAVFQLVAWWCNAHHWTGAASNVLLVHAHWTPPVGWWPWLTAAALGTASLLLAAMFATTQRASPRSHPR